MSTTVLGPTPLLAANFVIFGRITRQLGPAYSRIRPRTYTALFCGVDIISLLVQGGGGGIASSAKDDEGAQLGSNVMLGGIIIQVVAIFGFSVTAIEYLVRHNKRLPFRGDIMRDAATADAEDGVRGRFRRELKIMVYALAVSIIVLFIRGIYRVLELADGWDGEIMRTEIYFNIFDAAMIVIAIQISFPRAANPFVTAAGPTDIGRRSCDYEDTVSANDSLLFLFLATGSPRNTMHYYPPSPPPPYPGTPKTWRFPVSDLLSNEMPSDASYYDTLFGADMGAKAKDGPLTKSTAPVIPLRAANRAARIIGGRVIEDPVPDFDASEIKTQQPPSMMKEEMVDHLASHLTVPNSSHKFLVKPLLHIRAYFTHRKKSKKRDSQDSTTPLIWSNEIMEKDAADRVSFSTARARESIINHADGKVARYNGYGLDEATKEALRVARILSRSWKFEPLQSHSLY
ncbi:hypothetical protein NLJ89_g4716 [Agrocybe chaxingu]|uniref:Uncharacterized protein n=1 Tax=Agrocybe chaxingu TaxID=84603 RepID=A0A9W8K1K3_9AGAR|nr:hypothetical protein NLJ89_g4716 [Agrocybe chaxingu]